MKQRHSQGILAYFFPHSATHEKAKLLSWHFLFIYFLLFALLRVGFDLLDLYRPGVLGVESQISVERVIEDTNRQRQNVGLQPLKENSALDAAARAKAANMFAENYWAHFSPSGKDPWGFIKSAGYKFSYAGENLARNFYNSEDVVTAWMNSPSHKDNLLNPNYQDIGIAVAEGVLQGQKTTLVVQMFGKSYEAVAVAPQNVNLKGVGTKAEPLPRVEQGQLVAGANPVLRSTTSFSRPLIDPFAVAKTAGIFFVSLISLLLLIDFITLKRRGVFRISSHHFAHLGFLAVAGASVILSKAGEIL